MSSSHTVGYLRTSRICLLLPWTVQITSKFIYHVGRTQQVFVHLTVKCLLTGANQ